jgi:hypothetical protein
MIMKLRLQMIAALIFITGMTQAQMVSDSTAMGAGYSEDVFYSFANGTVLSQPRNTWDIAFTSQAISASILINTGSGAALYVHPTADTTQWATLDTAGLSTWPKLYNSDTTWEEGAFCAPATGHPDYGWGLYNSINHDVYGHRIFIVKQVNGDFRKIWIKRKYSLAGAIDFVYANLDNSDEQVMTIQTAGYSTRNFIYFSMENNVIVDYEPVSTDWDVVFTRYWDHEIPYFVTGVLHNYSTKVAELAGADPDFVDYGSLEFSDHIKMIGSDWKVYSMTTMTWEVEDTKAYFVETRSGDVYKLVFTRFDGTGTGKSVFKKQLVHSASNQEIGSGILASVYPNPANGPLFVGFEGPVNGMVEVNIYTITGTRVYNETLTSVAGGEVKLNNSSFTPGFYLVEVKTATAREVFRLVFGR